MHNFFKQSDYDYGSSYIDCSWPPGVFKRTILRPLKEALDESILRSRRYNSWNIHILM